MNGEAWKHIEGQDIVSQVAKAPDGIKRQAALVLLQNGAKPRHIRKKLDMTDRQLKVVERLYRHAKDILPNEQRPR
jgi:hypothetical protein